MVWSFLGQLNPWGLLFASDTCCSELQTYGQRQDSRSPRWVLCRALGDKPWHSRQVGTIVLSGGDTEGVGSSCKGIRTLLWAATGDCHCSEPLRAFKSCPAGPYGFAPAPAGTGLGKRTKSRFPSARMRVPSLAPLTALSTATTAGPQAAPAGTGSRSCSSPLLLNPHLLLVFVPTPDMPAHATATRSCRLERGAKDGVAAEGAGAGPRGAQIPLCERGALLLRANGRRER